jgi:hypothetical protein
MARRLFRVTREFSARIPGAGTGKIIKAGDELWSDPDQKGDTTVFLIDNLEYEVDTDTFKRSTQLKNG